MYRKNLNCLISRWGFSINHYPCAYRSMLKPGDVCVIRRLGGCEGAELNGRRAVVMEVNVRNRSTVVRLMPRDPEDMWRRIQVECLDPVAPPGPEEGEAEDAPRCSFCMGGWEDGPLCSPCACRGTAKFVHATCVMEWHRARLRPGDDEDQCDLDFKCPTCKTQYTGDLLLAMVKAAHGRVMDIVEEALNDQDPETALKALLDLANAYGDAGEWKLKIGTMGEVLRMAKDEKREDPLLIAIVMSEIGYAYKESGYPELAKKHFQKALEIKEFICSTDQSGSFYRSRLDLLLASYHSLIGDVETLKEVLERILASEEKKYGTHHEMIASCLKKLGAAYMHSAESLLEKGGNEQESTAQDLRERAKAALERALRITEKKFGADHPEVLDVLFNLGECCGLLGDAKLRKDLLERARSILEREKAPDHMRLGVLLESLASAYGDLQDTWTKNDLQARARELLAGEEVHVPFVLV